MYEEINAVQPAPQTSNNYATLNTGSTMYGQGTGGASAVADAGDSDGSLDC
jgi:hypothetical protein